MYKKRSSGDYCPDIIVSFAYVFTYIFHRYVINFQAPIVENVNALCVEWEIEKILLNKISCVLTTIEWEV